MDDQPSQGLVGIQVNDPRQLPIATRTVNIGTNSSAEIEILEASPCNETGSPKDTFPRDTRAHVNVTVKSISLEPKTILVTVFACDNDSTALTPEVMHIMTTTLPNATLCFKPDIYIQPWASVGQATFHVNAYSDWPERGGFPYAIEKTAKFNIIQAAAQRSAEQESGAATPGVYSTAFRLAPYSPFGTYTVNVTAFTQGLTSYGSTTFTHPYQILGDVDFNHVINILDVVQVAAIYGVTSGTSLWNPEMDIFPDGKIDISDVVTAAQKYGTRYDGPITARTRSEQDFTGTEESRLADLDTDQLVFVSTKDNAALSQTVITGVDVYTQYPDPFNGKGLNMPSDMFWPQKEVRLTALAVYNLWPVQQILVAFQVIDPYGQTKGIFYNTTDGEGLAFVKFTLPWSCEEPELDFGEWTVAASADIGCTVYVDILHFKYDYRLRLWSNKLSTDKPTYAHEEMIHLKIEYGTQSMQPFPATFTITAVDELGVPFTFEWASNYVGNAQYGEYANNVIILNLYIPKFASAGIATIYVEALRDLQSREMLCPGCSIIINIEPR